MKKPLISIITVCYNAGDLLHITFKSLHAQTYTHWEHIVIDGKSKDHSSQIFDLYRSRITTLVSEPDKGLYDAMNKGMALAKGDYVYFLNAGDAFYEPQTLSLLFEKEDSSDVVYGEAVVVNLQNEILGFRNHRAPDRLHAGSLRTGMVVSHQAFFVKRSLSRPYNLQYPLCADIDWMIDCLKKAQSIRNSHLTVCRFLEGGISGQKRKKAWKERYEVLKNHYGFIPNLLAHGWIVLRYVLRAPFGGNKVN